MNKELERRRIASDVAATCPAMRSRALARVVGRVFDEALRPHGVNSTQFAVLIAIAATEESQVKDVADAISLSRPAATRSIDILEGRGLVQSTVRSARFRAVVLTEDGWQLVQAVHQDWRQARDSLAATIGQLPDPSEIERFPAR